MYGLVVFGSAWHGSVVLGAAGFGPAVCSKVRQGQ